MENITIFGAGTMGRGIAHVAALGGYNVVLSDVSDDILRQALEVARKNMEKGIERGKVTRPDMDAALGRIALVTDPAEAAKEADLVIEAIIEELDVKLELFLNLDNICRGYHFCNKHQCPQHHRTGRRHPQARSICGGPFFQPGSHYAVDRDR